MLVELLHFAARQEGENVTPKRHAGDEVEAAACP